MTDKSGAVKHDVFVGNILHSTPQEQLYEVFGKVGEVLSVRQVTDRETGKPKGFAFIEYADAGETSI